MSASKFSMGGGRKGVNSIAKRVGAMSLDVPENDNISKDRPRQMARNGATTASRSLGTSEGSIEGRQAPGVTPASSHQGTGNRQRIAPELAVDHILVRAAGLRRASFSDSSSSSSSSEESSQDMKMKKKKAEKKEVEVDELAPSPTPGVKYNINEAALNVLLQIKPRISDAILTSGNFFAWKIDPSFEDYGRIVRYFSVDKASTMFQVKNVLRITRMDDLGPHPLDHGPKMMLFHGTKEENVGEILDKGFLPSLAVHEPGIYFADGVETSMQFCKMTSKKPGGWVFICEVLLGTTLHTKTASTDLPTGYDSIKRIGGLGPDEKGNETDRSGVVWPLGRKERKCDSVFPLNEYIVFCERQARPRYLIEYEKIPSQENAGGAVKKN